MSAFNSIVWDAAEIGDIHVLTIVITSYPHLIDTPNPREQYQTPIHIAAEKGHVEIIEKLVELGSQAIDTPDYDGWTPLYVAARYGYVSVIETLVRLGSQAIDIPNKYGMTPMFKAVMRGHVSVIETLVRLGSKAINIPNNDSWTLIYAATYYARYSNTDSLKTLKLLGADCSNTPIGGISDEMVELLKAKVDEGKSLSIRCNVYFQRSFSARLLFEVEKQR